MQSKRRNDDGVFGGLMAADRWPRQMVTGHRFPAAASQYRSFRKGNGANLLSTGDIANSEHSQKRPQESTGSFSAVGGHEIAQDSLGRCPCGNSFERLSDHFDNSSFFKRRFYVCGCCFLRRSETHECRDEQ